MDINETVLKLLKKITERLDKRDRDKHEYRGSIYVQHGRKLSTAKYESEEFSISFTRRYDDDEPDRPTVAGMVKMVDGAVKVFEKKCRGGSETIETEPKNYPGKDTGKAKPKYRSFSN